MFVKTSNANQKTQTMINKDLDEFRHNGELSVKEKEQLIFANLGALRAEMRSLSKQVAFVKRLERQVLLLLLLSLISGAVFCVFLFSLV